MSLIKEIEVTELAQLKEKTGSVRVIDIRQPAELNSGIIPGAEALPMHTIPLRINELNRDETLIMVCRSGARSAQACMFLQQQGGLSTFLFFAIWIINFLFIVNNILFRFFHCTLNF